MKTALLSIVEEALETTGITYRVFECDPELADTATFCEQYGFTLGQSANTIIVASRGVEPVVYACCVVLATSRLDVNGTVRRLMSVRKASFAPMDDALKLSGMEYGGVTAFGMPARVPIYVDAAVMDVESEIVMGGGNRTSKVVMKPSELKKIPGVEIIDFLAKAV